MKRIMLVEDEENLHLAIKLNLEMENYNVTSVYNGKNAAIKFRQGRFDLIILDVMLPEINGFDICESIRLENSKVPILFLTAKSSNEDKLIGLKMADDYLTKPFSMEELLARMKAILNRTQTKEKNVGQKIKVGAIAYEPELRILHLSEGPKKLTTKENLLLRLLVKNQNALVILI